MPARNPAVAEATPGSMTVPALPADPLLSPLVVAGEAAQLRRSLAAEVPHLVPLTPESERRWLALTRLQIAAASGQAGISPMERGPMERGPIEQGGLQILRPQLLVVVDRAPAVQQLAVVLARPDGPWEVLGAVHVSTGQAGRFDHYVTPTGVFRHSDAILDYRAQGTYNENHIRGLGLKGMRVWDFGWHWARKGWSPGVGKPEETQIRLEMHATDPAVLEQRIGRTASQGCVRIPSAMNRFLDVHGVLDATYERVAVSDIRYRALLLPDRAPSGLAGDTLVIVDSSARPGGEKPGGDHPGAAPQRADHVQAPNEAPGRAGKAAGTSKSS
jgi:hypothetical protein